MQIVEMKIMMVVEKIYAITLSRKRAFFLLAATQWKRCLLAAEEPERHATPGLKPRRPLVLSSSPLTSSRPTEAAAAAARAAAPELN